MSSWSLAFDYAALTIIAILLIWYLSEKRVPMKSFNVFFVILINTLLATTMETIDTYMLEKGITDTPVFELVVTMEMIFVNLVAILFMYYVSLVMNFKKNVRRALGKTCSVAAVIVLTVNLLNPFIGWVYKFEDGEFVMGFAGSILSSINVIMIVIGIVTVMLYSKNIPLTKTLAVLLNMLLCVIAGVIQIKWGVSLICFAIAIGCTVFYHYLHNPGNIIDTITGLFNRNFMGEFIQSKFNYDQHFSIIVVAMDDFKFVNKTYGVDVGDSLLSQVANYLKNLSSRHVVFRFGSDQFCIVINKNRHDIDKYADEILERFKHPWYSESTAGIMMSASICCIKCPEDADTYGDLIDVMDYSMSYVKKNAKGSVCLAKDIELDKIKNDKAVEKAVKLAMDRDELMVYYQPIFSVDKDKYNSAEALVRLKDDELGWISPEVFIPIAEKNGLIVQMGEMILEKVCRFIRDFKLAETDIEYIEVNISPVQMVQLDFADKVKDILEKYGVKPSQINMEITETATMSAASVVRNNMAKLVEYGINFSLDDYGSGHANIDYINKMPFKIIKLDKYIIWDAFKNDKAGITLEYTIGMLNALELLIVAEGVETAEMRDKLSSIGCHYMQGWYYSKAVEDKEFIRLVKAG